MILDRTFHPDEANQAFTTGRLLDTGVYVYNPQDHHGPSLYYAAAALQRATGHNSTATLDGTVLRCTPIIFSVLTLLFGFLAVRKLTGRIWHGILFALLLGTSPMFVFFSTDFIQEMLLASFTMMMLWAGIGYLRLGGKLKSGSWALLFGITAGLAFATKETSMLTFIAATIAALPFAILHLREAKARTRDAVLAFAGFALTAMLFYSSFGENWQGISNAFVAAPFAYLHRAIGSAASQGAAAHIHPWWQYLEWLFFGKIAITHNSAGLHISGTYTNLCAGAYVLFCCTIPLMFRRVRQTITPAILRPFTFLLLYTSILLGLYSAIPYKTPWCTLQIHLGYLATCFLGILIFGELIVGFSQWLERRHSAPRSCGWAPKPSQIVFVAASGLIASIILTEHVPQLIRINRDPDSKDIPYNYASASPQVKDLASLVIEKLDGLTAGQLGSSDTNQPPAANSQPQTLNPKPKTQKPFAAIVLPPEDTWPLPFYLRSINDRVGYWTSFGELEALAGLGQKPDVVVVPAEEGHLVQPLFPHLKNTKRFEMRPHVRIRAFW